MHPTLPHDVYQPNQKVILLTIRTTTFDQILVTLNKSSLVTLNKSSETEVWHEKKVLGGKIEKIRQGPKKGCIARGSKRSGTIQTESRRAEEYETWLER